MPGDTLKALIWGNYMGHLVPLPLLRDHCTPLPDVQSLETIVSYTLYIFSFVSGQRVNPVPVTKSWSKV